MSVNNFTPERLVKFLRQSPKEGLINPAVAKSRLNAVEQLFTELSADEMTDIRLIDVDDLCSRQHKIHDSSIRPEVVQLYNKRVKAALIDYFDWVNDPSTFISGGGDLVIKDKRNEVTNKMMTEEQNALEEITLSMSDKISNIISIPIRDDRTIFIKNLPLDLSRSEASKLANVIQAMAKHD